MAVDAVAVSPAEVDGVVKEFTSSPSVSITNPKAFALAIGLGIAVVSAFKLLENYGYITRGDFSIPIEDDGADEIFYSLSVRDINPNASEKEEEEEKTKTVAEQIIPTLVETQVEPMTADELYELHNLLD